MKTYDDDLDQATRKMWRKLYELADTATKVYDEKQRARKGKSKIVSEEEDDESFRFLDYVPRKIRSSLRDPQQNYENLNGASTSSSLRHLRCFQSCSSLLYNKAETKSPNSQSSCLTKNTSRIPYITKQRMAREMPEWLVEVTRKMNADEYPRVVFVKPLSASDVDPNMGRLLIPFDMLIRNDFLTHAESQALEKEDVDEENLGVGTILVSKNSDMLGLGFKKWLITSSGTLNYVLTWGWNDVVKGNNLKARDEIRLWSFRCRGVLCFALELIVPKSKGFVAEKKN